MALAPLNLHRQFSLSCSSPLSCSCSSSTNSFSPLYSRHFQTPHLFKVPKKHKKPGKFFCVSSSTPSPNSSPIFLPFLQTPARKQNDTPEFENDVEIIDDPILKFFKTRTADPDPTRKGKIVIKRSRSSLWRLAPTFENTEPIAEPEPEPEPETANYQILSPEKAEAELEVEGVVRGILRIARALPENVTIGEALERCDFGGRLGEEECVEVLRMLGEEGNVVGCLYFFEWMGLREPCLVSPKACAVLFPVLGRAKKGDELLLVFKNLPFKQNMQFKDVRVYNSALSGLLFCGRYWIFEICLNGASFFMVCVYNLISCVKVNYFGRRCYIHGI